VDPRPAPFRVLSLCSGIGGLDLGLRIAVPGARTVCYVEREAFCCEVLAKAGETGLLDRAPVWTDLGTFDGRAWRGRVDCIIAGFPCQPVSSSGKRRGIADARWLWPEVERVIAEVRPRLVFLENVPGLVRNRGAFGAVLAGLAHLGFDAEWTCLRAADVGAPHQRTRVFILARRWQVMENADGEMRKAVGGHKDVGRNVADADDNGVSESGLGSESVDPGQGQESRPVFPPRPDDADGWRQVLAGWPELAPMVEYKVRRVADGFPAQADELRALGNAVVPLQAAAAFALLARRAGIT